MSDGQFMLEGPGHDDQELVRDLIGSILQDEVDDLELPRNYTGELVFQARIRLREGILETVDHSLERRRRRRYA